jgi:hypothetical protein
MLSNQLHSNDVSNSVLARCQYALRVTCRADEINASACLSA